MNLKLRLAGWRMSESMLIKELGKVANLTTEGLDELLQTHAPNALRTIRKKDVPLKGDLQERRSIMASRHNIRVQALIKELGENEAIRLGRVKMFEVGKQLGHDARKRLGVGDELQDLISAAKVLYKVLGISFNVEEKEGRKFLRIGRCALADHYTAEACHVLSAADEGVVRGLNPQVGMTFKKRITEGESECIAYLELETSKVVEK